MCELVVLIFGNKKAGLYFVSEMFFFSPLNEAGNEDQEMKGKWWSGETDQYPEATKLSLHSEANFSLKVPQNGKSMHIQVWVQS